MSDNSSPENRLAGESSPYLQLHKANPVDWYPWGPEALERARAEDKPIFLSVGYSTCYWCHVMERESFSDDEIAATMNREFVNVKLDREERPDLDEIYMTATQVLTEHGGWPNSVFLTPDLKPYFAGTYFPPEDRSGQPGFLRILLSMAEAWKSRREDVLEQAEGLAGAMHRYLEERTAASEQLPAAALARESLDGLSRRYDATWGGFGAAPKFPTPSNLLLLEAFVTEDAPRRMLTETVDQMVRGGIYDRLGGGFHRYSTDAEWKIPHFEKMLHDNGLLLEVLAREWDRDKAPEIALAIRETVGYLDREMTADDGAYQSALDAETEGVEGAFYVWSRDELQGVLGDEDFGFLAPLYGFDSAPFFEERHYVLHLPRPLSEQAKKRQMSYEALLEQVEPLRARLFEARQQRRAPLVDRKVLADWNGMTIAGVAEAGRYLAEPAFVARAGQAARAVLDRLRPDGRLAHVERGEQESVAAFLSDYVFLVRGLIALHRADGDPNWLGLATELTVEQHDRLADPEGGFYAAGASSDLLFRSKEIFDGATPAANSVAVLNLLDLAELTGEDRWLSSAVRTVKAFSELLTRLPEGARTMMVALRRLERERPGLWGENSEPIVPDAVAPGPSDPVSVTGEWIAKADTEGLREFRVEVNIPEGWHLYARSVTAFEHLDVRAVEQDRMSVEYPPANGQALVLESKPLEVYVGRIEIRGRAPATEQLSLVVSFQACEESRCLPPRSVALTL